MAISAGVHHLPDASSLAKLIGAPPKVKGSPAPMGVTVLPKAPTIQKGTDSQLELSRTSRGGGGAGFCLGFSRLRAVKSSYISSEPFAAGWRSTTRGAGRLIRAITQQQRDGSEGKASAAVGKQVMRFLSCCPAKCPSKGEACSESPIDGRGGIDMRLQHDNLFGALRRLRCIQRTGLDPVCHCSCLRCGNGKRHGWSEGIGESPNGGGRAGSYGRWPDGFCIQDDVVGRTPKSAMELCILATGSTTLGHACLGVLQRNRLYSIEAPGDSCKEGCSSSPSRPGATYQEEKEISKGWPEAEGGGQGILDHASRDCRAGDGLSEDVECLADTVPSEVLKEEDPCQFDRWCSESGRIPGDKVDAEDDDRGDEPGCGEEEWTIKGELGADNNPLKPIPFPSWVEKFVGQVIAAKTRFSFFVKSAAVVG